MDAAVSMRNSCLIGGIRESVPGQSYRLRGCVARFNSRSARKKADRISEGITFREELQDFCSGCTERAVPRTAFWKWRRRERTWLVRYPVPAVHGYSSLKGTTPGLNLLPLEKEWDCCDRTYRVKSSLGVPGHDAAVKDGIRHGKEHLYVVIEIVPIPCRDKLRKEVPVTWRQLRMRAIRPVFGDHFLLIGEIGADRDQVLRLFHKRRGAEKRRSRLCDQRSELITRSQRKGGYVTPEWGYVFRSNERSGRVKILQGLPMIHIEHRGRIHRDRARKVQRNISGVIGIRYPACR
jgi:hypothetical protein